MGTMFFPGEKVKAYLPPREGNGDIADQFGAWLTDQGAEYACYIVGLGFIACVVIRLFVWVIQTFCNSFLWGVLSCFGAALIALISLIPLIILSVIAYVIVWSLGWLFSNAWTLIACLILTLIFYLTPEGQLIIEQSLPRIGNALLVIWQWYKCVL